ncbi:MAG: YeeE/YedE family protein [Rhodospirillaceae bacterium]|nr:YeeE/YedE family protein [Rhodospirillaceae bacterium]
MLISAVLFGLVLGAIIGAAAFLINFCVLGAVADILFATDWRRMRAWMLAAGIALLGTQSLSAAGLIVAGQPDTAVPWRAILAGGVMFGYGMALAGGCLNRALVRLGAGSLKSLVILAVAGLTAAAVQAAAGASVPATLSDTPQVVTWVLAILVGGGLTALALADSWFRQGWRDVLGSIVIGLCIALAWLATTWLADPTPVNFAQSAGDLFALAAPHAGLDRGLGRMLGIALLAGVPLGAFLAAVMTRNLGFETFTDRGEFARNIIGGILMGAGGILAWGDTFGQGLSGLAMLSVTAPVAILGMFLGCLWGIRAFEAGGVWPGLKLAVTQLLKH